MADSCVKCKKSIEQDALIVCNAEYCQRTYHRCCVDVDDVLFEAIEKNPLITFSCEKCKTQTPKALVNKLSAMEDKLNKLTSGITQIQARLALQYMHNGNAGDGKNSMMTNLIVVGNNCNSDKLHVVCDYGRWVQVGKFATATTEDDIVEHLAEVLKINKNMVKCTKLVKNDANLAKLSYCKFKISIPDYRFNELYNESIWPSGVMVSPFTPRSQMNQNRI